ncbi:MAG: ABC transporter permease [Pseudomonadales bacterium]|nr:ABC transporter permease [Pseudomonadales bacterium]
MFEYFSKYWFDFVWVMTLKEIKARYKRVFLGFLWAILNPILQMIVIGFLFQFFIPMEIDNYFYFLFAGLLPWNFFSYTFSKCTPLMLNERALIQKAKFPREALVLSIVFSNLFHLIISLLLFVILVIFVGYLSIYKIIILFLTISWLVFFTIGISLLLSTLYVRYRDIKFIVQAVVPLWFYATPIIYTRSLLPASIASALRFNPMTGIVELFQFIFVSNNLIFSLDAIIPGILISFIITIVGIHLFKRDNEYFDDWL